VPLLRVFGWAFCSALAYCTDGGVSCIEPEPPPSIASLNAELPVHIPASARLLGVHRESGMDDMTEVKLEMSAADLPAFLASSPLADVPLDAWRRHGALGPDHDFWDPDAIAGLRSAQASYPDARSFNLGVYEREPGVVVVYLCDFGT
jgi:hypothetical protein